MPAGDEVAHRDRGNQDKDTSAQEHQEDFPHCRLQRNAASLHHTFLRCFPLKSWTAKFQASLPGRDMPELTPELQDTIYTRLRYELRDIVCAFGRGDDLQLKALIIESVEGVG